MSANLATFPGTPRATCAWLCAIDTSTDLASIAFFQDGHLRAFNQDATTARHGEALVVTLAAMCEQLQIRPSAIATWAVGIGPGSFTGVRIALATAIGIRQSTGATLVGVDSFDAINAEHPFGPSEMRDECIQILALPALPGEFYVEVREPEGTRDLLALTEAQLLALLDEPRNTPIVLSGAALRTAVLPSHVHHTRSGIGLRPSAKSIGDLAFDRLRRGMAVLGPLEPCYVGAPKITVPKVRTFRPEST